MDATRALFKSSQGTRSVAECAVDFLMASRDSGWNPTTLYDAFYQGLAPQVKDKIAARELPYELDDLIFLAHPHTLTYIPPIPWRLFVVTCPWPRRSDAWPMIYVCTVARQGTSPFPV